MMFNFCVIRRIQYIVVELPVREPMAAGEVCLGVSTVLVQGGREQPACGFSTVLLRSWKQATRIRQDKYSSSNSGGAISRFHTQDGSVTASVRFPYCYALSNAVSSVVEVNWPTGLVDLS